MSSDASFIDDGISLTRRLPATHHPRPAPSDTSAYTGSYIDDGADLLLPASTRGLGAVNPRFYKNRKRYEDDGGVWSDDIARAVGGDIQRSLSRLLALGGIDVKKAEAREGEDGEKVKRRREERRGVVFVPRPLRWGIFVIKGEDGRVVVVGETGEWDSGAVEGNQKAAEGKEEDKEDNGGKRWVRAASTINEVTATNSLREEASTQPSDQRKDRRSKHEGSDGSYQHKSPYHRKALTPVPESDYESASLISLSPLASPTNFLMTGGLSSWPSRTPSPVPASPIVPPATTWETSPARTEFGHNSPQTRTEPLSTKRKADKNAGEGCPSPSSPYGWIAAKTLSNGNPTVSGDRKTSRSGLRSRSRHTSSVSIFELENTLKGAESKYQKPDIVEVIYDETPSDEVAYSQAGWVGALKEGKGVAWDADSTGKHREDSGEMGSVQWGGSLHGGSAKGSVWGGSRIGSHAKSHTGLSHARSQAADHAGSHHAWDDEDRHGDDEGEWDGFERPKTESEVSVYGGSVRSHCSRFSHHSRDSRVSWPASQRSGQTHRSTRSRRSHGSRYSNLGWDGEGTKSKAGSAVHWDEDDGVSVQNWRV